MKYWKAIIALSLLMVRLGLEKLIQWKEEGKQKQTRAFEGRNQKKKKTADKKKLRCCTSIPMSSPPLIVAKKIKLLPMTSLTSLLRNQDSNSSK